MKPRATVIIPTFGNAKFTRWAIKSVQNQSVEDIEIYIICDGSPEHMITFFKAMGKDDPRIKVITYPKSPRHGEPYRDIIIKRSTGKIICYCSHDDLWLPNHIQEIEKTLSKCIFTHSILVSIKLPENIKDENIISAHIMWINLENPGIANKMIHVGGGFFGLSCGAHTREGYFNLDEGWVTTPQNYPTDRYMWRKFVLAYRDQCKTTSRITTFNFRAVPRKNWSEQMRDDELKLYFEKIQDPDFLRRINEINSVASPSSELNQLKILGMTLPQRLMQVLRDRVANSTKRKLWRLPIAL
jgi:glycosyltransferase involved in cell wall biosynthesis